MQHLPISYCLYEVTIIAFCEYDLRILQMEGWFFPNLKWN